MLQNNYTFIYLIILQYYYTYSQLTILQCYSMQSVNISRGIKTGIHFIINNAKAESKIQGKYEERYDK